MLAKEMRIIRSDAFDYVSFGENSIVATYKATNWKYYPMHPVKTNVHVMLTDQTIGVYSVQYEDGSLEDVVVKYNSDFLPCKRCHLICDPLEQRPFGACRWHTKAPLRMPLSEFKSDPSLLDDTILVKELMVKLQSHVGQAKDDSAPENYYFGSLRWIYSKLESVIHRYNVNTDIMVKVARHRYEAFNDALDGNEYDAQMPIRLSKGKFVHDRWTCCGQPRKDAIGCWIGDHSFTTVDPCLHDASRFIRGTEHMTLPRMREIHLTIEQAASLTEKVRVEAMFNMTFGAIYLKPEMMWVVSPTNALVVIMDTPSVEYPKLEKDIRAVNNARDGYRYELAIVKPMPEPKNVESSEEVHNMEENLVLGRLGDINAYNPYLTRIRNAKRLEEIIDDGRVTDSLVGIAKNVNNLMRYTPCLLLDTFDNYAGKLLADLASVVFQTRNPGEVQISPQTHDYFLAHDLSRLITQDIIECQRIVVPEELRAIMNDVLSVNFVYKPTFYRAALPEMTSAMRVHIERQYGPNAASIFTQLSWLLHTSMFVQVNGNPRAVKQLISNRLNIIRTGRVLDGFTYTPNVEKDGPRYVIREYITLFARGYYFALKAEMPAWVIAFMEKQLLFIEMLNVVYSDLTLHTIEANLLNQNFKSYDQNLVSIIDRLMAKELNATSIRPSMARSTVNVKPMIGRYYLSKESQKVDLNKIRFPTGMSRMLEDIRQKYKFEDIGRVVALRMMIDTITERFGFGFQEKLAKIACCIDYMMLMSDQFTDEIAEQINDLFKMFDTPPVFAMDLFKDLIALIQFYHAKLVSDWIKTMFEKRFESSIRFDFALMNTLNDYREFDELESAIGVIGLFDVFSQFKTYVEVLELCIAAYGKPKSKSLQRYVQFITTKYAVYDPARFTACVVAIENIKESFDDIDEFILDIKAKSENAQRRIETMNVDNSPINYRFQQLIKQNPNTYVAAKLISLLRDGTISEDYDREVQRLDAISEFFTHPDNVNSIANFSIRDVWDDPGYLYYRAPVSNARTVIELLQQSQRNTLQRTISEIESRILDKKSANYTEFRHRVKEEFEKEDFEYNNATHFLALISNVDGRYKVLAYCIYSLELSTDVITKAWNILERTILTVLDRITVGFFKKDVKPKYLFSIRHLHGDYLDVLLYWLIKNRKYGDLADEDIAIVNTIHVPSTYDIITRRVAGEGCRRKHEDIALIRSIDIEHYLVLSASISSIPAFINETFLSDRIKPIVFHNTLAELEPNCSTRDDIDQWEARLYNSYANIANNILMQDERLGRLKKKNTGISVSEWLFEDNAIKDEVIQRLKLKQSRWNRIRNAIIRKFAI